MRFEALFSWFLMVVGVGSLAWLLQSCASQSMPSGGPKDETSPKLVATFPSDQSTNFKGTQIILQFDEDIQVKNLTQELQIVPNIDSKFKHRIKRNLLLLDFEKPFADSTTYSLFFGESIGDITEFNKPENIKIAFSTWQQIDSFYVEGIVKNLLADKPAKSVLVTLYNAKDTLDVQNDKPLYYAKTDTTGYFIISNIKAGDYFLYALQEDKGDYKYNKHGEKIGFLTQEIAIRQPKIEPQFLYLADYDLRRFKFVSARPRSQFFEVKYNKGIKNAEISFADSRYDTLFFPKIEEGVITFFNKNETPDSVRTTLRITDSTDVTLDTTLTVRFEEVKRKAKMSFSAKESPANSVRQSPDIEQLDSLVLTFSKPVLSIDFDSMGYTIDTLKNYTTFAPTDWLLSKDRQTLRLLKSIPFESRIAFNFRPKTFVSIENDTLTQETKLEYMKNKVEDLGLMRGKIVSPYPVFLQVLGLGDKVEKELYLDIKNGEMPFEVNYLSAGKKKLRLLVDENRNGRWENGSFEQRVLPEKVVHFGKEIEVRANWEVEGLEVQVR
ncbi:Ig-like domain-containing domain [Hugenholtzia roseola]|uniref:Ig-like domain-containing domain n=1 Tax=Hugenholtzia roseola TaxID=1002 RepID=UPI0003F92F8D|nr:Ig-like domain-containing domain [Hugenholtzia roseola]